MRRSRSELPRSAAQPAARWAGFTLLELVLVIIVASVVAVVVIERFLYYQEGAEKAAMESVLAVIKTGLQIRVAELIVTNRQAEVAQLAGENPVRWLNEPPSNYAGEYRAPIKPGNWYFATEARQLVYVPVNNRFLELERSGKGELRFEVKVRYTETDTGAGIARILSGVTIAPIEPYHWL